jgi:saccharopine dehydrogenase (NAD+, L-lysine-forming)
MPAHPTDAPVHLWLRAEARSEEARTPLLPDGAADLVAQGFRLTVEDNPHRCVPAADYVAAGCARAPAGAWRTAPRNALILGLKELPEDGAPLVHRHIFFGHAYKGQPGAATLLARFRTGGGALYDLEYLTDADGRRVAAFGYWAGYAGAAAGLMAWAAQHGPGGGPGPDRIGVYPGRAELLRDVRSGLAAAGARPNAIVIGALGRVGSGACDLLEAAGITPTRWDMAETAHGGPFPEILTHDLFVNAILAGPGTPCFVGPDQLAGARRLSVIADIACDPGSPFNPIPVYRRATSLAAPTIRVADGAPPLDIMAIDNLPAMLPAESSADFAAQLLAHLRALGAIDNGVWARARAVFDDHIARL